MRKFLLSSMLFSAFCLMAQTEANPPQTAFFLSGINGETTATENNTLSYIPGDDDDIEEGIYRYGNANVVIEDCADGLSIVGAEGMIIGYDPDNFMGQENLLNDKSTNLYLIENGETINCELSAGSYNVMLASFYDFEDETESSYIWSISFTNNDTSEKTVSYYIVGLNDEDAPAQSNRFIEEVIEDEEEGNTTMYVYPKFYIEGKGSFSIVDDNFEEVYGGSGDIVTGMEGMAFAMLSDGGDPVEIDLEPGYYTLNFAPMSGMAFLTFIYCEDQTPADECTYYLSGFGDDIEFTRIVEESSYEDEETGETISSTSINYVIEKVHLSDCPDGFTVISAEGQGFSFGLNEMMAAFMGDTISADNPMAMVGIYGSPIFWDMEENDYTVTFYTGGAVGGYISFEVYGEGGDDEGYVDAIGSENATPIYFDLQGRKIANPEKGLFIKKTGNKVEKVAK